MANTHKAFGYLRVSSVGQVDGDGFPRQRAAIASYAEKNGIEIVRYFEERGVSGTKDMDDRPALQEMLVALMSNGVKTVIIEKLDRLARDLMVQEAIIRDLQQKGFEIVSVAEPDLCTDDASRILMRQMFGAIAQYEKTMIVAKLKAARQRTRKNTGRCEGRKPYGFREGEPENIRRITELYEVGQNYSEIALTLNAEGRAPRTKNSKWYPSTVANIIRTTT
jgi:DNA invertase Pin-like site-specific DNA recombinase